MNHPRYQGPPSAAVTDLQDALVGYDVGELVLEQVPLARRAGQEFYLERRRGRVHVRDTTPNSLENAIYTLLGWYGLGESWFVKPKALPKGDIPGRWIPPTRTRAAGTRGSGAIALTRTFFRRGIPGWRSHWRERQAQTTGEGAAHSIAFKMSSKGTTAKLLA
jgi:hypothetical protein